MSLIRTVLQPGNIGLSRQFQRCQIIKTSSDLLHPVLIETSNLEHGSNIRWHGRSYAASASSETLETKKTRGRVSKDVRKSMVENYVNKYREINAGKFPTTSEAKKDVGGSYYVVREILQELKYNFKMSSVDDKDTSLQKSAIKKKDEISANTGEVSQARNLEKLISPISKVNIGDSSSESSISDQQPQSPISVESDESKDVGTQSGRPNDSCSDSSRSDQRPQSSILVESDGSEDVGTQSHNRPIDKPKRSLHFDNENDEQKNVDKDKKTFDGSESKAEPREPTEISGRKLLEVPTEDAEDKTKSSMWQNLKSFANGILGMWKRS